MRHLRLFPLGLLAFGSLTVSALRADLVWSPDTGWKVEGGVLAGFSGEDGRNAVELMNRARQAEEADRDKRAIKTYRKVFRQYPKSIYAPEAYYRTGTVYLKRRDFTKSFESYQSIVMGYPNYEKFSTVIGDQYRIASALGDGARGRIFWFFPGMTNRDRAVQFFEQVVANAPYSDYAPLALMNVAKLHQREDDQISAITALDRMINLYPNSILTPDAYLGIAKTFSNLVDGAYYDQSSTNESITYYQDFMILFPGDPNVGEAEKGLAEMKTTLAESKLKIAEFYHFKRGNLRAAKVFYNEAITAYPDSAVAKLARTRLDVVEAKLGEAEQAKTTGAGAGSGAAPAPKKKRFLGIF